VTTDRYWKSASARGRFDAAVPETALGDHAAARRAHEKAAHDEVGLVDVLQRVGLLAERHGKRLETDGPAVELLDDRLQDVSVELVEPLAVHLQQLQGSETDVVTDAPLMAYLGEVADAAKQPVGDARRAARATGDGGCRSLIERHT